MGGFNRNFSNRRLSWTLSVWWTQSSVTAYHCQMFSCASGSLNMRQYSRFTQIILVLCHPQLATNLSLPWQHKWCSCPNIASHLQTQSIPTASMPLAQLELWEFHLPFSPTICFIWSVTVDWNPTTILRTQCSLSLSRFHQQILKDNPTLSDRHKAKVIWENSHPCCTYMGLFEITARLFTWHISLDTSRTVLHGST
jgi:hypothetical protein